MRWTDAPQKEYVTPSKTQKTLSRMLPKTSRTRPETAHKMSRKPCRTQPQPTNDMLRYAIIFLVTAIIAAVLGFGVIAGTAAWIAKGCFIVFLILAVLAFLRKPK